MKITDTCKTCGDYFTLNGEYKYADTMLFSYKTWAEYHQHLAPRASEPAQPPKLPTSNKRKPGRPKKGEPDVKVDDE